MKTVQMRERLHHYMDVANDPQLHAIYLILEDKIILSEGRISIHQYNDEVKEAEERIDEGNFYSQEEIKKLMSS